MTVEISPTGLALLYVVAVVAVYALAFGLIVAILWRWGRGGDKP